MKYVIKFSYPMMDSNICVDAYVSGLLMPEFKVRPKVPGVDSTPYLSKAIVYSSWDAASAIVQQVCKRYASARIYGVTEKDLFKAKLAER